MQSEQTSAATAPQPLEHGAEGLPQDEGRMTAKPAIAGIDHVLVGVADLEQARQRWRRLGFMPSPRGRHIGWGTANYCIMFPNGYVELLGIVDSSQFTNNLDKFLEVREGLLGVALASDDAAVTAAALQRQGIAAEAPKDLARIIELPSGEVFPCFKLLELPDSATPGLSAFVCQHLTPEMVWQAAWCRHPNGASGLLAATVVVDDPSLMAIPYGELFGFNRVWVRDGSVEVNTGRGNLIFTTASYLPRIHPGLSAYPFYPAPWLAALRVAVEQPDATAYFLEQSAVPFRRTGIASLIVAPTESNGVILEFTGV